EESPIEESPIEESPIEESPIEESPIEESPIEESPIEESPIEDSFLFSLDSNQKNLDGLNISKNDIVQFDGNDFSLLFDGSDVAAEKNIDAFDMISDTEILMSFNSSFVLDGVGEVSNADILKFTSTSLGSNTAGIFEIYLDGSDLGLSGRAGNIDGLTQVSNGDLLISISGKKSLSDVGKVRDEDILRLTPTTTGDDTKGSWSMYLDGSNVGLKAYSENIDALSLNDSGDLFLSTHGDFDVTTVAGANEDILVYTPSSSTTGTYSSELLFEGAQFGLSSNDISAIDISINLTGI
ncbi:MAG: hypothetical protein F6K11_22985, partial [Leptolyngbya sp. SIO3F4]|nr:hypothetical protein [Leptolyngbya sp. SIO3F4]